METRSGDRPHAPRANEQERLWIQSFQRGDASAFHPLVRPHLPALLALARRHCRDAHFADDLVQETLVRALRGLHGFRGESAIRTWLFRILLRLAAEPARWQRGERAGGLDTDVPDHFAEPAVHGAIERELAHQLEAAMERLPVRQRTALHLRAVEGLDYAAIAEALECSQPAARMLVLEARRKVLARIGEQLEP